MKNLFILSAVILIALILPGCDKGADNSTSTTDNSNPERMTDSTGDKILSDNALKPLITINNPNSMEITTTPRDKAVVAANRKTIETFSNEFLKYAAANGLDAALEEMTKAKTGALKDYLLDIHCYAAILGETEMGWAIVAHATNPAYVGAQVDINIWADLTKWQYLKAVADARVNQNINQVWLENIYWRDPNWAGEKEARFSAYDRIYKIDGKEYWLHYSVWLDS